MTRRAVTLISLAILGVGLVAGAVFAGEATEEVPIPLPALAEKIRNGEIDVGTEYGLAPEQRYHTIHAAVLGLECTTCHTAEMATRQEIFFARDVSPQAPAPVDRRACLGCHRAGPGANVYGSGSR